MTEIEYLIYGASIGAGLVAGINGWALPRFRKPKTTPNHARLIMEPGATLDLVNAYGVVQAKVVLSTLNRDRYGTSAQFVDYYRWVERNTYRG